MIHIRHEALAPLDASRGDRRSAIESWKDDDEGPNGSGSAGPSGGEVQLRTRSRAHKRELTYIRNRCHACGSGQPPIYFGGGGRIWQVCRNVFDLRL